MNSIVDYFLSSVERYPANEAVIHKDTCLSYKELFEKIEKVKSYLLAYGVSKGDRVALLLGNTPDYIAFYYGILMAGGCVVALNSAAKIRDIRIWLNHSEALFLVVETSHGEYKHLVPDCHEGRATVLLEHNAVTSQFVFKQVWDWEESFLGQVEVNHDEHDLAAIIYTSGTTGVPKGVTLTHGNLFHNVTSILSYLELTSEDRILNVLPFYYSYGNSILHTHLAVGGTLVLEDSLLYPHHVVKKMEEDRVTGFSGVPSTFALLLSRVNLTDYDLSSMRYMTQAGGAMSPAHVQRMREELPDLDFIVMYGQTEATARISYLQPDRLVEKLGSVGRAIPGVEVKICDEKGETLPAGEQGEIWVRGNNIMKGYWKSPELTETVMHGGWLKTGDLAELDKDGFIYIRGRNSEMIKTGAHRVSPQKIEEVISELNSVAEVGATGVSDDVMDQVIKVVVVPVEGNKIDKNEIQQHCKQNLAAYERPKIIEIRELLPKTASGKIQRFMLAEDWES